MLLLLGTAAFSHVFSQSLSPPCGREEERPDSPSYLTEGNCQHPHTPWWATRACYSSGTSGNRSNPPGSPQ